MIYGCKECKTHLAIGKELLSKVSDLKFKELSKLNDMLNTSLVCSKRILKGRQEGHFSSTKCKYLINISHKLPLKVSLLISKAYLEFNANQIRIMKQIHNDFVKEVEIHLFNMSMTSWRRFGSTLMIRNTNFFFCLIELMYSVDQKLRKRWQQVVMLSVTYIASIAVCLLVGNITRHTKKTRNTRRVDS